MCSHKTDAPKPILTAITSVIVSGKKYTIQNPTYIFSGKSYQCKDLASRPIQHLSTALSQSAIV